MSDLFGWLKIRENAALPENVVEFRRADGSLAGRFFLENGRILRDYVPGNERKSLKLVGRVGIEPTTN